VQKYFQKSIFITNLNFIRPYVFEVPAWFAHNHKIELEAEKAAGGLSKPRPPYRTEPTAAEYEAIKEPTKFGQIRNYLHPVKVKNPSGQHSQSTKNVSPRYEHAHP
jgi:hypothetical protein